MNRLEVQDIYNRLNKENDINVIKYLGFKSCVFYDLFGMACTEPMKDEDVYLHVNDTLKSLCKYALDNEPEPVAKDYNGDPIYIGGTVYYDGDPYTVRAYEIESEGDGAYERILVTEKGGEETPQWLYIGDYDVTVKNPNAQNDALAGVREAMKALQKDLQENVFPSLEKVLESLREAQKD